MEREENGIVGIFDINFDNGERVWSHEMGELFGIAPGEPPEFQSVLRHVHPEDRRAFNMFAVEPFRPNCPPRTTSEFRVVRDDASIHWLRLVRITMRRDHGVRDVVRVLGFVAEISEPTASKRSWQQVDLAA
jgi:hypothetical protein